MTAPPDLKIARPSGTCAATGAPIAPGDVYFAALRETPAGFERVDVSRAAWDAFPRGDLAAFWRATMPRGEPRRKPFVDDRVLLDLLERLRDAEDAAKLAFRFVLALILLRKKLVTFEGQTGDVWHLKTRVKDGSRALDVLDPKPSEEQFASVREQLNQVLSEDVA